MSLISEGISVKRDEVTRLPVAFQWRGRECRIEKILKAWQDWGFGAAAPAKKTWRLRRHRNFYQIRTAEGDEYEMYLDRGAKGEKESWVLLRQVSSGSPAT